MVSESLTAEQKTIRARLPFTRADGVIAGCLFVCAIAIYIRTLAPDLLFGDSGEFQVLSLTGGLGHAFGYPVYLAFGKLFSYLPFFSVPARISFLSAFCASSCVAKVYLSGRCVGVRKWFAAISACALMVAPLYWWQSIIAEVYTIGADFLVACLLCCLIWRYTRNAWWLAVGGFMAGLCLGMHHAVLLASPFILAYLFLTKATRRDWGLVIGGAAIGIAISVAAYLIMGSINSQPTATNFLKPAASHFGYKSPDQLDEPMNRIKFAFFATQFQGEFQAKHIAKNVPRIEKEIVQDFGWFIPLFAVLGIIGLFAKSGRRREGVLIVGSYLALLGVPMLLDAFDLDVEFIQAHVLMCLLAGVGLQFICERLAAAGSSKPLKWATTGSAAVLFVLSSWGILSGAEDAVAQGKPNFLMGVRRLFPYEVDTPNRLHELATSIIENCPDNALLLADWSKMDAYYYVALFEQNKPRILIVAPFPSAPPPPAERDFIFSYYLSQARSRPILEEVAVPEMGEAFFQQPALEGESGHVYLYAVVPRSPVR